MSNYDKIKTLLENKDYKSALLMAFSNSLKFKLTTTIEQDNQTASIETQIDLLKGITTTVSDPELLNQDNNLDTFHQQQLATVEQTWQQNREMLVAILQVLAGNQIDDLDIPSVTTNINQEQVDVASSEDSESEHSVDQIMSFMLDEEEDSVSEASDIVDQTMLEQNSDIVTDEDEDGITEDWNEFMDELSPEEQATHVFLQAKQAQQLLS